MHNPVCAFHPRLWLLLLQFIVLFSSSFPYPVDEPDSDTVYRNADGAISQSRVPHIDNRDSYEIPNDGFYQSTLQDILQSLGNPRLHYQNGVRYSYKSDPTQSGYSIHKKLATSGNSNKMFSHIKTGGTGTLDMLGNANLIRKRTSLEPEDGAVITLNTLNGKANKLRASLLNLGEHWSLILSRLNSKRTLDTLGGSNLVRRLDPAQIGSLDRDLPHDSHDNVDNLFSPKTDPQINFSEDFPSIKSNPFDQIPDDKPSKALNFYQFLTLMNKLRKNKRDSNLDSLGGSNLVKKFDQDPFLLGSGSNVGKRESTLDSLGGSNLIRNVESDLDFAESNPTFSLPLENLAVNRLLANIGQNKHLNSLPNSQLQEKNFQLSKKGYLDSLGVSNLQKKDHLDTLGGSNLQKKDHLDTLGGSNLQKRLSNVHNYLGPSLPPCREWLYCLKYFGSNKLMLQQCLLDCVENSGNAYPSEMLDPAIAWLRSKKIVENINGSDQISDNSIAKLQIYDVTPLKHSSETFQINLSEIKEPSQFVESVPGQNLDSLGGANLIRSLEE